MSGSYSPPLPLVYLEFRYLSQTKHLCFLQSWGNKSFLLEAVTSTNRSNKSLQGRQIQGESRITWQTDETSLSFSLCPFLKSSSEGEVLVSRWWPVTGCGGMERSWIRASSDWTLEKGSSLGGWSLGQAPQGLPLPLLMAPSLPVFKEHLGCSGWHSCHS